MSSVRKRRNTPPGSLSGCLSNDANVSKRWKSRASADKSAAEMEVESLIEHESKIRDGALKLIQAATSKRQSMEAAKSLMTSNARLLALMSRLQKTRRDSMSEEAPARDKSARPVPCKAKVTISDIRIPLEVKDVKEQMKGSHKNDPPAYCSVFCLFKLDGQIHETEGIIDVTRNTTDIVFPDSVTFHDVEEDFKLHIELYCAMNQDYEHHIAHRMLRKTVSAFNKKDKDDTTSSSYGHSHPKYTIVGHSHLCLRDASNSPQTHTIKAGPVGASPSASCNSSYIPITNQLSLWGQFCCLLRIQPDSATGTRITGFTNVQRMVGELPAWTRYWCVMRQNYVRCWVSPEDIGKKTAIYSIAISEDMEVINAPRLTMRRPNTLLLKGTRSGEEHFISFESKEEKSLWHKAIVQCLVDQKTWKQWSNKVTPQSALEPWQHSQNRGQYSPGQLGRVLISPAPTVHTNIIERTSTASPLVPPREKKGRRIAYEEKQAGQHANNDINLLIDNEGSSNKVIDSEQRAEKENTNHTNHCYVEMAPLTLPIDQKKRRAPAPPTTSPKPKLSSLINNAPVGNGSTPATAQSPATPQSAKKHRAPDKPADQLPYKGKTQETPTHLYTAM